MRYSIPAVFLSIALLTAPASARDGCPSALSQAETFGKYAYFHKGDVRAYAEQVGQSLPEDSNPRSLLIIDDGKAPVVGVLAVEQDGGVCYFLKVPRVAHKQIMIYLQGV